MLNLHQLLSGPQTWCKTWNPSRCGETSNFGHLLKLCSKCWLGLSVIGIRNQTTKLFVRGKTSQSKSLSSVSWANMFYSLNTANVFEANELFLTCTVSLEDTTTLEMQILEISGCTGLWLVILWGCYVKLRRFMKKVMISNMVLFQRSRLGKKTLHLMIQVSTLAEIHFGRL